MSSSRSDEKQYREILVKRGETEVTRMFPNNYVSTTKYNIFTLIPKNLFEQFHRVANIWFLLVSIFQVLPLQLSPTSSWATISPLTLVLTVTMIKDAYLDYCRYRSDKVLNNKPVKIWSETEGQVMTVKWMDLEVGNIVILEEEQPLPADIVIFSTSDKDRVCSIETSNLDGESNLKTKYSLEDTANIFDSAVIENNFGLLYKLDEAALRCEHPNNRLYTFEGSLKIKGYPKPTAIENCHLLLRGSTLKNTRWVLGFVVYTGNDTKQMMNSKTPPHKRSRVERQVNRYLSIVFSLLFFAAILSTVISIATTYSYPEQAEYYSGKSSASALLNLITFLILYNSLVPISLYVTMDIIRIIQAQFIQWDLRMYYAPLDQPAIAKTGDLNEDLGQIEYIFSDKTGTLTENQMLFKRCSIAGNVYGIREQPPAHSFDQSFAQPIGQALAQSSGQPSAQGSGQLPNHEGCVNPHPKFKFYDPQLLKDFRGKLHTNIYEFLECLSVCHTVITDKSQTGELVYQAASPDEEALVIAAHGLGFSFQFARKGFISVDVMDTKQQYSLIGINEFNSDRRRMSVVIRNLSDAKKPPILYCKGADNVILQRVKATEEEKALINEHLNEFSVEGLRTLVLAKRELTEEQVKEFERKWTNARNAIADRTKRLEEVAEEFERDMTLVGVTAIEDKIQEGVPEAIADLIDSGVKVWVLTGDRQETAINIGYACKLLKKNMTVLRVNIGSEAGALKRLKGILDEHIYQREPDDHNDSQSPLTFVKQLTEPEVNMENINIGLVVDGESLIHIFKDSDCIKYFSMIACLCHAVICCGVSPLQKAMVLKMVKNHFSFKPMTLAIGDGANDVSMIQEAHVGVGICGKEGLQAANSSDYAVARFRYLLPLLFLHGRWNYRRISLVVLYSFYKNFLLVLPMFYYSFHNLYSGTALYDSWLIMSYNVALTAIPIMVIGSIDKDVTAEEMLGSPKLYHSGIFSKKFNALVFLRWTFFAILHSLVIYFFMYKAALFALDTDGHPVGQVALGTATFYCVVQTACNVILQEAKEIGWIFAGILALSNIGFFLYVLVYDALGFPTTSMMGLFSFLFSYPSLLLAMVLAPLACTLVHMAGNYVQTLWYPNRVDRIQNKRRNKQIHPSMLYQEPELRSEAKAGIPMRAAQFSKNLKDVFDARGLKGELKSGQQNRKDISLKPYTLRFNNPFIEKDYKTHRTLKIIRFIQRMFIVISALNFVWTVVSLATTEEFSVVLVISRCAVVLLLVGIVFFSYTNYFLFYYEQIMILIIVGALIGKTFLEVISESDGAMSTAIVPILTFVLFDLSTFKVLIIDLFFLMVYLARVCWKYSLTESTETTALIGINYILLLTIITFLSAFVGYSLEKSKRYEFILLRHLRFQYKKGQDILGTLLPKFVRNKVKQGIRYIAEDKGIVTVLFCDIYDFDNICATHTPNELLDLLDKFFSILDNLCEKHGVTKIETVGKTYMACGGLKDSEAELPDHLQSKHHAIRTVELAFDILEKLEPVFLKTGEKFHVKIGVNSGPVVAGVVGEHKPQFSLVGDTVNTASRMCSTITLPDYVQISSTTYSFCESMPWEFEPRTIQAKGKGTLQTYYTMRRRLRDVRGQRLTINEIHRNSQLDDDNPYGIQYSIQRKRNNEPRELHSRYTLLDADEAVYQAEGKEKLGLAKQVQWLTCSFKELRPQYLFRVHYVEMNMKVLSIGILTNVCIYFVMLGLYFLNDWYHDTLGTETYIQMLVRALGIATLLGIRIRMKDLYKSYFFPWLLTITYSMISFAIVLAINSSSELLVYKIVLEVMHTNLVLNHISGLPFGFILIGCFGSITNWFIIVLMQGKYLSITVEATFFILTFMVLNGAVSYTREKQHRRAYNLNKLAQREIVNTDNLLKHMMPPAVVRNLKNDIVTTDKYSNVTIIFADICGFTNWSADKKSIDVISMLSKLFSAFDQLCSIHGVYKVHTIGDCYVVLSFTDPGENEDESERKVDKECNLMIDMALDMVKSIKKINRSKKLELNMRIGIHTGEVIAGISGTNIVRYDIYGPDVDIANKMESQGMAGCINISEDTRQIIERTNPDRFDYKFNKVVEHKPVSRKINSFFVLPLRDEDIY